MYIKDNIKFLGKEDIIEMAHHKHVIDAFLTNENNDDELVVAMVVKVRLADIKAKKSWKSIVTDAKRNSLSNGVEIYTEPESRVPTNSIIIHHDSGNTYDTYRGYNVQKQQDYIKKNGKRTSERYKQFFSEPSNITD